MIGICNLSIIPVRKEPDSKSEIVSQLLFGETFEMITSENGWQKIVTINDQYSGWISSKQFEILQTSIQHSQTSTVFPFQIANSIKGNFMITAGSSLPNLNGNNFSFNNHQFELEKNNAQFVFSDIEKTAIQYLNVPYLWGGKSPFGIDCSGFTQTIFAQCGIHLMRDAYQQAEQGNTVSFKSEVKCGDLAFFDNDEGKIIHVGIMLNADKIIHASGKVRIDSIDDYGIMNKDEKQYSHKLRIIKRISE